jgi:uncharacterized protein YecE (DUF72 family)
MTEPQPRQAGALVGCAGWSIPKGAAAAFPEQGSHLERYAAVFTVVEINTSFYRPHQPKTYARWGASVPDGFRFSVKLPKAITHEARLRDADDLLARFAQEARALGNKLGCVLVQLPPSLAFEIEAAAPFLDHLRATFGCTLACEARHPGWFAEDATELLRERGIVRVRADPPAGQPGPHVPTTASAYVRLHGSPVVYRSDYPAAYLDELARELAGPVAAGHETWCVFDNTLSRTYMEQALYLRAALERESAVAHRV